MACAGKLRRYLRRLDGEATGTVERPLTPAEVRDALHVAPRPFPNALHSGRRVFGTQRWGTARNGTAREPPRDARRWHGSAALGGASRHAELPQPWAAFMRGGAAPPPARLVRRRPARDGPARASKAASVEPAVKLRRRRLPKGGTQQALPPPALLDYAHAACSLPGRSSLSARRPPTDCVAAVENVRGDGGVGVWVIADGLGQARGQAATAAADAAARYLRLSHAPGAYEGGEAAAVHGAVEAAEVAVQTALQESPDTAASSAASGACISVCLLYHRQLWVASLGNCRVVLGSLVPQGRRRLAVDVAPTLVGRDGRSKGLLSARVAPHEPSGDESGEIPSTPPHTSEAAGEASPAVHASSAADEGATETTEQLQQAAAPTGCVKPVATRPPAAANCDAQPRRPATAGAARPRQVTALPARPRSAAALRLHVREPPSPGSPSSTATPTSARWSTSVWSLREHRERRNDHHASPTGQSRRSSRDSLPRRSSSRDVLGLGRTTAATPASPGRSMATPELGLGLGIFDSRRASRQSRASIDFPMHDFPPTAATGDIPAEWLAQSRPRGHGNHGDYDVTPRVRRGPGDAADIAASLSTLAMSSSPAPQRRAPRLASGPPTLVATSLTSDHTPQRSDERGRVLLAGGRVMPLVGHNDEALGDLRVWLPKEDAPGLAVTRCLGHTEARRHAGVSSEPEVTARAVQKDDAFVVLASDGVWCVVSTDEAVRVVADAVVAAAAAETRAVLAQTSSRRVVGDRGAGRARLKRASTVDISPSQAADYALDPPTSSIDLTASLATGAAESVAVGGPTDPDWVFAHCVQGAWVGALPVFHRKAAMQRRIAGRAAAALVAHCRQQWEHRGAPVVDDISAVVVLLSP